MNIRVYQINPNRDTYQVQYHSFADMRKRTGQSQPDPAIYDRVFTGDVDCDTPEAVFRLFKLTGHRLNCGHAITVSDIVELREEGEPVRGILVSHQAQNPPIPISIF